jgi:S1-C subfamily serine protease
MSDNTAAMWLGLLAGAVSCALLAIALVAGVANSPLVKEADSVVKVYRTDEGHGSGVHIGSGYVLTAAHVLADQKEIEVKTTLGEKRKAEILWVSAKYDLAIMRVDATGLKASPLSCARPMVGEEIEARGNPLSEEFMTTHGKVSSTHAGLSNPDGHDYIAADLTVAPGMSGGPVLNRHGYVVGIVSAMMGQPAMFSFVPYGISYIVPGDRACFLLARA